MAALAGSLRIRPWSAVIGAAVVVGWLLVAHSPIQATPGPPADPTASAQGQLAILVVGAGLVGLIGFGVRRLGMRMLVSRRARRP